MRVVVRHLGVAALLVFASPLAIAQAELDHFAIMQDFSRYAAIYDHAAELGEKAGKPASAEEYRGVGRGARLVANFSAMLLDAPADDASDADWEAYMALNEMRMEQIESIYSLESNRQRAWFEQGEVDLDGLKRCIDSNPLQAGIVEQVRRSGYLSSDVE